METCSLPYRCHHLPMSRRPRPADSRNRWPTGLGLVIVLSALALGGIAVVPLDGQSNVASPSPLVFTGVTVIDVRDGRHLPGQTVVIAGTRIRVIGPVGEVRTPQGATVVNARGKYLIPGLWDMHIHPMAYTSIGYPLLIANGVTGARDAGSDVPLATLVRWKREIAQGTRVGPRLIVSGPSLDERRDDSALSRNLRHHIQVSPSAARRVVDSLHDAGADILKMYDLGRAMYFDVAAEARRLGMMFGGHTGLYETELEAADSGARFFDHDPPAVCSPASLSTFDTLQCAAAARRLRQTNTWMVATAYGFAYTVAQRTFLMHALRYRPDSFAFDSKGFVYDSKEDLAWLKKNRAGHVPMFFADWAKAAGAVDLKEVLSKLATATHAGIPIVAGSDACITPGLWCTGSSGVLGFSLHEDLVYLVLGGMTPLEALQAATLNPALALEATDSLGTVTAGKLADLVLLDADPLADIWNTTKIRAVVANGRYFNRRALDGLLTQAAQAARTAPSWETVLQRLP